LWKIYQKYRDEVEITDEAAYNIDYELKKWEAKRRIRWN